MGQIKLFQISDFLIGKFQRKCPGCILEMVLFRGADNRCADTFCIEPGKGHLGHGHAVLFSSFSHSFDNADILVLTNEFDTFVPCCQKLSLSTSDGKYTKLVDIADFCKVMEGSKYFIAVDRMQFVLKEMPKKEWDKMVKEMKGEEFSL